MVVLGRSTDVAKIDIVYVFSSIRPVNSKLSVEELRLMLPL